MTRDQKIAVRYKEGFSSYELSEEFGITPRSIQRALWRESTRTREVITRGKSDAFKLAIKKGRMKYYKKPEHLKVKKRKQISLERRYRIHIKYGYKCAICGAKAEDR